MSEDDEAALIERAMAGDGRAFGELVGRYERLVFNVALRMVNHREDARDLTQTVFIKAYAKLQTFDRRHKFFSWIYRITINESLNHLSRRRRHEELDDQLVSEDRSPEERLDGSESEGLVQAALMELAEDHRQAIILRHFLDLSHREMSGVLNIPEKTVKSRLYTARQVLGDVLRRRGVTWP
jgi:RNA polymerase sigma-70 factor (ECF subfamily)